MDETSSPTELPAGPALDAAMQRVLRGDYETGGWPPDVIERICGLCFGRSEPT